MSDQNQAFTPARRVTPVDPAYIESARQYDRADRARRAADRRAKALRGTNLDRLMREARSR